MYFFRDQNGREVDLVLKQGDKLIPFEIKVGKTFHTEFLKGLHYFKNLTGARCQEGVLIYDGEVSQRVQSFQVSNVRAFL